MEWDDIYKEYPLDKIPWHSETRPKSLARNIEGIKRGKALDLCSGAGTNSIFLSENGFDVVGIDISETAISIAEKRAKNKGLDIDFRVADVMDFQPGKKFDFALDRGCFHHMPKDRRREFAGNLSKMLKDGAKFQLMAFSKRNEFQKSLTTVEIREIFSAHFDIGEITEEKHIEPDGSVIFLYNALMTKKAS